MLRLPSNGKHVPKAFAAPKLQASDQCHAQRHILFLTIIVGYRKAALVCNPALFRQEPNKHMTNVILATKENSENLHSLALGVRDKPENDIAFPNRPKARQQVFTKRSLERHITKPQGNVTKRFDAVACAFLSVVICVAKVLVRPGQMLENQFKVIQRIFGKLNTPHLTGVRDTIQSRLEVIRSQKRTALPLKKQLLGIRGGWVHLKGFELFRKWISRSV